jgi:cytochrome c oxidase subunit III
MIQSIEAGQNVNDQRKKIHPHRFTLWVGMGSIVMMFAGLTSAYVVKRDSPGWTTFVIPRAFWYSTAIILVSSLTMQMGLKAFKDREMRKYRNILGVTMFLGIGFLVLQWIGFKTIWNSGVHLKGSGAGQFLYIIAGLHGLHIVGGIIALILILTRAFNSKIRSYNSVPVENMSTYWHFVDILWIYLFIFFWMIQ